MVAVAVSYDQVKPSVLPFSGIDFDPEFTSPSSILEFQFDESLRLIRRPITPAKAPRTRLFTGLSSEIIAAVQLLSRSQTLYISLEGLVEGSPEERFVAENQLHDTLQIASILVSRIFGEKLQIAYEYCRDPEDASSEWLDINVCCQTDNDDEIELMLDHLDLLNEQFAERVAPEKEILINFHLDIV